MIEFLQGKKSYLIAIAMGVVVALAQLEYIDIETGNWIISYLVPAGLITLKAGQGRIENKL